MKRLNNKGVTFIELLISIAILALVGVMLTSFAALSARMYHSTVVNADVQTESQMVFSRLERAIMGARSVYMEEGKDGIYLFIGDRIEQDASAAYQGEIFWWNRETGCLYQNSSFAAVEEDISGDLSGETVKASLESGADGGKEYLISDKVKTLEFSVISELDEGEPLKTGDGFTQAGGALTIHYEMTFQYMDGGEYALESSVLCRNRVKTLWWKEDKRREEPEER